MDGRLTGYYDSTNDMSFLWWHYIHTKQDSTPGSQPQTVEEQSSGWEQDYLNFAAYWAGQHPGKNPPLTTYSLGDKTTWTERWRRERYVRPPRRLGG